jgi:ATP-dependent protease ClpP protease subunit
MEHDELELWKSDGLCISTRTIYFGNTSTGEEEEGINCDSTERLIKNLFFLDNHEEGPITLMMNCIGGDEIHGWAIYDFIASMKNEVTIEIYGHCYSMAPAVLQAATIRKMSKNSQMMIHYGDGNFPKDLIDAYSQMEHQKQLDRRYFDLLFERIKIGKPNYTKEEFLSNAKDELYLDANEALKYNLIDEII